MQAHILLSLLVCFGCLASVVHSAMQYKIRGPPMPPRHTRNPQHYMKPKWPVPPQRNQMRPNHIRPIPVHMASYKVPVLARPPKPQPSHFNFPSAVWKSPTAVYKPPTDNKPFINSPPMGHSPISLPISHPQPVISPGYDFHVNKEPIMNYATIKQIGEKGPIHTIPAPNLSIADKPKLIFEGQAHHKHTYQYTKEPEISPNSLNGISPGALLGAQALPLVSAGPSHLQQHQYQVTENAETADHLVQQQFPFTGQKNYYEPDPDTNLIQKLTHYADSNALATNMKLYPQDMFVSPHQFVTNAANAPLSSQDLYQLLNGIPQQQVQQQQQQHLIDSYGISVMQQPQLQQHFVQQAAQNIPNTVNINYQSLFHTQPQYAQQDTGAYYNQIPDTVTQEIKDNFKPQYHSFNYEEQDAKTPKEFAQSRVTADYSIEPVAIETSPKVVQQQSPQEALAQTQYIQQYFATREDNNIANNNEVENQDNGNGFSQILSQLSAKNEIPSTIFYSSLPNKETADTLATLQAAGNINNLLKLKQKQIQEAENQRDQMRIYVPDEEESYEDLDTQSSGEKTSSSDKSKNVQSNIRIYETTHLKQQQQNADSRSGESLEYEDYSGEESANATAEEEPHTNAQFGKKLQTKSNSAR